MPSSYSLTTVAIAVSVLLLPDYFDLSRTSFPAFDACLFCAVRLPLHCVVGWVYLTN